MKLILIIFFVLVSENFQNNKTVEVQYFSKDLEEENLLGHVAEIRSTIFHAQLKDDELIKTERGGRHDFDYNYLMKFDKNGNKISKIGSNKSGKIISQSIYEFKKGRLESYRTKQGLNRLEYDETGKQIKELELTEDNSVYAYYVFEYDKENLTSKKYFIQENLKEEIRYSYVPKNNQLLEEKAMVRGKLKYKIIYGYDLEGRLIETSKYLKPNEIAEQIRIEYKNGYKSRQIWKGYGFGKLQFFTEKIFEKGNVVLEVQKSSSNKIIEREENKYKYDSTGNWIRREIRNNKGGYFIIEREISYY